MQKKKVYAKFITAFIFWILIFFFTRTSVFKRLSSIYLSDLEMIDMSFFIFICFLLSAKYIIKIANLNNEIYVNPAKIYDFMNSLIILMLVKNIMYIDITLLSSRVNVMHKYSLIIFIANIFLFVLYFCKNKIKKFKKIYIVNIFAFSLFVALSSDIELLFVDVVLLLYYISSKIKVNVKLTTIIDKVFIILSLIAIFYFINLYKNGVVILNCVSYLAYYMYMYYEKRNAKV